jgi:hypothetical protein
MYTFTLPPWFAHVVQQQHVCSSHSDVATQLRTHHINHIIAVFKNQAAALFSKFPIRKGPFNLGLLPTLDLLRGGICSGIVVSGICSGIVVSFAQLFPCDV